MGSNGTFIKSINAANSATASCTEYTSTSDIASPNVGNLRRLNIISAGSVGCVVESYDVTAGETVNGLATPLTFIDPSGHTRRVCTSTRYVGNTNIFSVANFTGSNTTGFGFTIYSQWFNYNTGANFRIDCSVTSGIYTSTATGYLNGSVVNNIAGNTSNTYYANLGVGGYNTGYSGANSGSNAVAAYVAN